MIDKEEIRHHSYAIVSQNLSMRRTRRPIKCLRNAFSVDVIKFMHGNGNSFTARLIRGAQYVNRDLPVDLEGALCRSHDIHTLTDSLQCKSSE